MQDSKFCVYAHYRKDTGAIFYIGQGTQLRARCSYRKLKAWNTVVAEAGGFTYKILESNLTKEVALEIEEFLIKELANSVVNLQSSCSTVKEMLFSDFSKFYYVAANSPSGLRYKVDVYAHDYGDIKYSILKRAGDVAGTKDTDGWKIHKDGISYRAHRVVCLLTKGEVSSANIIDHLDGNPFNNGIENLREVSRLSNQRNLKLDKRSTSGVAGVSKSRNNTLYRASVCLSNKRISICFSVAKYGEAEAFRLACEWRKEQIRLLNEQGAGYTDRHGT